MAITTHAQALDTLVESRLYLGDCLCGDPRLPGLVTAWRQRRNLELDVDDQMPRAPWIGRLMLTITPQRQVAR
jgi:hypothetical protein